MKKDSERIRTRGDGIRIVEHGKGRDSRSLPALAAVVVIALAVVSWPTSNEGPTGPARNESAVAPGETPSQNPSEDRSAERRHVSVRPARPADARVASAKASPLLDERTMEQLVHGTAETAPERTAEENMEFEKTARGLLQAAVAAGATQGIAAFPPPGTDPIKVGLVVPPNYELPEGFLRHHQITDDGRRLEPILMFSPDYEFVDASGNPITIPEDGIVPKEMAPAGMPLRVLAMPKNPYGPSPASK